MTNADPVLPMQLIDATGRQVALVVPADEMAKLTAEVERLRKEVEELRRQRDRLVRQLDECHRTMTPAPLGPDAWKQAVAESVDLTDYFAELEAKS